jgi:membrane-associated phospholipid phosphatase
VGIVAAAYGRGRLRWWSLFLITFSLATILRGLADETAIPIRYEYAVGLERWLPGPMPGPWLQSHLSTGEGSSAFNLSLLIYASYFAAPYVALLVLTFRMPSRLGVFVVAHCLMLAVGLVVFFLVPTAPPWFAAHHGDLAGVHPLILDHLGNTAAYDYGNTVAGANPFAAMPSFHMGTICLVALACGRRPRWAVLLWLYAAAMAFSIVFLGEHYLVDCIAGLALASVAWAVAVRGFPLARQRSAFEPVAQSTGLLTPASPPPVLKDA